VLSITIKRINKEEISLAMLHMYNTQSNKFSKTNQGRICQILCSITLHNGIKYNHEHRKHHPLHVNADANKEHVYLIQINELHKTQNGTHV
jgi:hypothetical protein